MSNLHISNVLCHKIAPVSVRMGTAKLTGPADLDEIRGAEKTTRKTYSYMLTESKRLCNKVVRQMRRSCNINQLV